MSDPALIKGCKLWDKITEQLKREHPKFYAEPDYEPLKCRIDGDKAEVTVGSSPGHRTHIVLPPEGRVDYYDSDDEVNRVMRDLLADHADLSCETRPLGVTCKGLTKDKIDDVFRVLSMATSMDIRLRRRVQEEGRLPMESEWMEKRFFEEVVKKKKIEE